MSIIFNINVNFSDKHKYKHLMLKGQRKKNKINTKNISFLADPVVLTLLICISYILLLLLFHSSKNALEIKNQ